MLAVQVDLSAVAACGGVFFELAVWLQPVPLTAQHAGNIASPPVVMLGNEIDYNINIILAKFS